MRYRECAYRHFLSGLVIALLSLVLFSGVSFAAEPPDAFDWMTAKQIWENLAPMELEPRIQKFKQQLSEDGRKIDFGIFFQILESDARTQPDGDAHLRKEMLKVIASTEKYPDAAIHPMMYALTNEGNEHEPQTER